LGARVVLQVGDPAVLAALLARRGLRRWLGRRLGAGAVLVAQEAPLRAALERGGQLLPAPPTAPAPAAPAGAATLTHLVLALRLAGLAAPVYAPAFARLAAELGAQLAPAERATLDDLWAALAPAPAEAAEAEETVPDGELPAGLLAPATVLPLLAAALGTGRALRIHYYSATRQATGWRVIEPLVLEGAYLTAYCRREQANRTFRLDRFLAVEPLGGTLAPLRAVGRPRRARPPAAPAPPAGGTARAPGAWLLPDYDDYVAGGCPGGPGVL
jgi:hypothetical protein